MRRQLGASQRAATKQRQRVGGPDNCVNEQHGEQAKQAVAANLGQRKPGKTGIEHRGRRPQPAAAFHPGEDRAAGADENRRQRH